ncbi:Tm-1-like ATP-binding domain-containing protein [Rhodobacteraceae bacterium N5(2021)]|uniref:Tm-1-like ATP-binding domain-containing protein n=1 Tax=Gymnodinialimonas phycosphaerae TaxID=2841589 RepID=A0A975YG43_9RHOB|nr:Tm-1-like ATP-binding domain-containing protein [Gymnodinialimonas phycosphaerae]MBY4891258.1 Tm-1-like ATP-binding domain-containing protein [Gymnodinialimonas phycosphaerae]
MARVLLIGTFETKQAELGYLADALPRNGVDVEEVDVSLGSGGVIWSGTEKLARMAEKAQIAATRIAARCGACDVALGVGGGTGGEIVLAALKGLPAAYPKLLITTLAFDPRAALADTAITLIPTLCDIEGLNPALRQVFENTAAAVAGLCAAPRAPRSDALSVAVTTLGATNRAGVEVTRLLAETGREATVFHANGYGGAAFTRFVAEGTAKAVIDLGVQELGRLRLAGAHVPMPARFSCANALPRVVLPGALNFIGLGAVETLSTAHLARAHYRHSGQFTHVKLTEDEMADQAKALAEALNAATAPCRVLVPMGGFSHEDRPGGAIEDPNLRNVAADVLEANARAFDVTRLPRQINTPETARAVIRALENALNTATTQRTQHV